MAKRKTSMKGLRAKYTGYADPYRQSYTTGQLLDLRRQYAKAVNQRILRMERGGYMISDSPAFEELAKQDRKRFSEQRTPKHLVTEKGISRSALKKEVSILSGFLGSILTTKEGRTAVTGQIMGTIQKNYPGMKLSKGDLDYLLRNFNDFKAAVKIDSDALLRTISAVSTDITNGDQIKEIVDELKEAKTIKQQAQAVYNALYYERDQQLLAAAEKAGASEAELDKIKKGQKKKVADIRKAIRSEKKR